MKVGKRTKIVLASAVIAGAAMGIGIRNLPNQGLSCEATLPQVVNVIAKQDAKDRTRIENRLGGKTGKEQENFKSEEIAKIGMSGVFTEDIYGLTIDILRVEKIQDGIQIFARAWKGEEQIGFGDGSVDIERFRVFNPPILVDDSNGDIVREFTNTSNGEIVIRKLREDPEAAIKLTLAHTIHVSGKEGATIVPCRIGNTTDTFFPGAGGDPTSGYAERVVGAGETFSAIRTGSGTNNDEGALNQAGTVEAKGVDVDKYVTMARGIHGFDTSSIPDTDVVTSATFSLYGRSTTGVALLQSLVIDRMVPASSAGVANSDYNIANWAGVEQASNRVADSAWSTSAYNDFTLNATGRANVSKTGNSWFGTRTSGEFDNVAPTWISAQASQFQVYAAAQAGTSNDPQLVVVHGPPTASFAPWQISQF